MSDAQAYAAYIEDLVDQGFEPEVDDIDYDPDLRGKLVKESAA